MKVTSSKTVDFPSLGWGIEAGEVKELPEDKLAQEQILNCYAINQVDSPKASTMKGTE